MKFELNLYEFQGILKKMDRIKNGSENILLENEGTKTKLIKTSENTIIKAFINDWTKDSSMNSKIHLPLSILSLLKKVKDNSIIIEDNQITAGNKSLKFAEVSESNYIKDICLSNEQPLFATTEKELSKILTVKYAIAKDDTRPILTGVCFRENYVCALDGFRLSLRQGNYINDNSETFTLNQDTLNVLNSIIDVKSDNEVKVFYDRNYMKFVFADGLEIIGTLFQGEFIKWQSIIPQDFKMNVKIDAEKIKEELDFYCSALNGNVNGCLKLAVSEDNIKFSGSQYVEEFDQVVSDKETELLQKEEHQKYLNALKEYKIKIAKSKENGKAVRGKEPVEKTIRYKKIYNHIEATKINSELPCITKYDYMGDRDKVFEIGFNPLYLRDAFNQYEGEIQIKLNSCVSPAIVTQDGESLELVLPVRIN